MAIYLKENELPLNELLQEKRVGSLSVNFEKWWNRCLIITFTRHYLVLWYTHHVYFPLTTTTHDDEDSDEKMLQKLNTKGSSIFQNQLYKCFLRDFII